MIPLQRILSTLIINQPSEKTLAWYNFTLQIWKATNYSINLQNSLISLIIGLRAVLYNNQDNFFNAKFSVGLQWLLLAKEVCPKNGLTPNIMNISPNVREDIVFIASKSYPTKMSNKIN